MNLKVSGVYATGFFLTGLVVGSSFGFVAGLLFLLVAYLTKALFFKKEEAVDSINSSGTETNFSQEDNDSVSSFQA